MLANLGVTHTFQDEVDRIGAVNPRNRNFVLQALHYHSVWTGQDTTFAIDLTKQAHVYDLEGTWILLSLLLASSNITCRTMRQLFLVRTRANIIRI